MNPIFEISQLHRGQRVADHRKRQRTAAWPPFQPLDSPNVDDLSSSGMA